MRKTPNILVTGLFSLISITSFCQLGFSFDIKKPKPYEDRVLKSEKSDKTKFNVPRRFFQNTFTHYNYYFNANNKLNEVLEMAKLSHRDDYSQLLTFYNYTLDEVSQYKTELDSLVYKAQTAIVLHDLRNDWIDNMYLIWGAAYYLRKDFDSAYLTFQFINYAFAPKEKDGYYKYIGSKADGNSPTNIANKEKNSIPKRLLSEPPSRNDAFIWQIRTHLAKEQYAEASSLIAQLRNDPVFPDRLKNDLEEVHALYFYQQSMWDSSAFHLTNALSNAANRNEKARWEYLIAQMYERSNRLTDAQAFYAKVISHTTDPVLEIYARLSSIRVNKEGGDNYIQKNIDELLKMGRRDRYLDYRDIIFLMAAQMELDRNDPDAAEKLLLKSLHYNYGNLSLRNRAFLQLAEIAFAKRKYRQAYNYYDSLQLADPDIPEPDKIQARKDILAKVAFNVETIQRQDSLQRLAGGPEEERKAFVKKLVKQLRKAQGLKDEDYRPTQALSSSPQTVPQQDLFPSTSGKGEWYFYNQTARSKGSSDFKGKWGNRPNVDNWRRSAAITGTQARPGRGNPAGNPAAAGTNTADKPTELTFDGLYENIPLTGEKMKASNDSIQNALFSLSTIYAEQLEDCEGCIEAAESLRERFPGFEPMDRVLFNLYHCYSKLGETVRADALKKTMTDKYGTSDYTGIVTTGKNPAIPKEDPKPTKLYENIYDLFIEGNFEEATKNKKAADSVYGKGYWTPQLLYIEAVYHAKQREDSAAKAILAQIIALYPSSPLAVKAETLINVLGRRASIENELANMVIETPVEDTVTRTRTEEPPPVVEEKQNLVKQDTSTVVRNDIPRNPVVPGKTISTKSATDSVKLKVAPPPLASYDYNPGDKHYVAVVLNKVDNVFRNEAKNAFGIYNREKYYSRQFEYATVDIDADNKLLLIGGFDNADAAIEYLSQAKPVATTRIMPWLKPEKYSFTIISERNLEILKAKPLLEDYRKFTDKFWQRKF